MKEQSVNCITTEPQFNPKSVNVITEGTEILRTEIDPLGGSIEGGEEQYFTLMRSIANNFAACLKAG